MLGEAMIPNLITTMLPLFTFLYVKRSDTAYTLTRDTWDKEYDYIIVGAGTAGSVLASRLSENPMVKVLLLEAGGSENIISDIPLAYQALQNTPIDWQYRTTPQSASCFGLKDKRSRWPRGKVLGGCSTINAMVYTRGCRSDYDGWAKGGASGWTWDEVFPYFIKSEDNRDTSIAFNGYHGRGGLLTIETPQYESILRRTWIEAGRFFGYRTIDVNGPQLTGFGSPQGTTRRGSRCSAAKAFLTPTKNRSNLHVVGFSFATKIILNEYKRAVAIQFDRFAISNLVYARKEIIISCGSINSPQLLMLSGIGPAHHLMQMGIPVRQDLPVGHNLQDHIYPGGMTFAMKARVSISHSNSFNMHNILKYYKTGRGQLTSLGGIEGLAFVKTPYSNMTGDAPDIEMHFIGANIIGDGGRGLKEYFGLKDHVWKKVFAPYQAYDTFSIHPVLVRPKSRGHIRLASPNPYDHPIIDPKYLTHPADVLTMVEGMKMAISIGTSGPFRKMGAKLIQSLVPGCEHYPYLQDEYLACVARTMTFTIYHPVGTCKMGSPWDSTAVVDSELKVIGIKGLRVVDASIMPTIISANTNAAIVMIAERAADMIKGAMMSPLKGPIQSYASPAFTSDMMYATEPLTDDQDNLIAKDVVSPSVSYEPLASTITSYSSPLLSPQLSPASSPTTISYSTPSMSMSRSPLSYSADAMSPAMMPYTSPLPPPSLTYSSAGTFFSSPLLPPGSSVAHPVTQVSSSPLTTTEDIVSPPFSPATHHGDHLNSLLHSSNLLSARSGSGGSSQ